MLVVLPPIFAVDTELIYGYNIVTPLNFFPNLLQLLINELLIKKLCICKGSFSFVDEILGSNLQPLS